MNFKKIFSIDYDDNHLILKILCFKLKFKTNIKNTKPNVQGNGNVFNVAEGIQLSGFVQGNNNKIEIDKGWEFGTNFNFYINITGNNNEIIIKQPYNVKNCIISIGNHGEINNCRIFVDEMTSMTDVRIYCFQHNSNLTIGKNCTFSEKIQIRTGEYPHLIFDKVTGEYLDKDSNINIGNHVWIGEGVTLLKNASIANDNIVGCYSVVTKPFTETNSVIAGNPAKIRKRNVDFLRNEMFLDKNSNYYKSFHEYQLKNGGKYVGNDSKYLEVNKNT